MCGVVLEPEDARFQEPKVIIHFNVLADFVGTPDLNGLGFEGLTATRIGVDFSESLEAIAFGDIGNSELLGLVARK